MLGVLSTKVAVIPIYASDMIGSLYVPPSATRKQTKSYLSVEDEKGKVYLETEDSEKAYALVRAKMRDGVFLRVQSKKHHELGDFDDVGDRCTQGIVKYIGKDVKEVKRGDYVIFSGYTGTLMQIEGEGIFIVMEEKFVLSIYEVDRFLRVPGLYIRTRDSAIDGSPYHYEEVTYEIGMNLLAQAITDSQNLLKVKGEKPKLSDYSEGA